MAMVTFPVSRQAECVRYNAAVSPVQAPFIRQPLRNAGGEAGRSPRQAGAPPVMMPPLRAAGAERANQ